MNLDYFRMINNTYKSKSKQETDLYLLNRHIDDCFADTIDYHIVKRNGEPFELLIIKDTDGNTFKKKIKSKHSTPFNLGDYIEWNNQIWLVTLLDTDDKAYHSGYMYLCTIPLRWQNSNGEIIERYAYSEDFTKYSAGINSNNIITIGDNQYGLTLPIDFETKQLNRDMRFVIDLEDRRIPDVYKITNRKVNLNNNNYFGRGGTMILTMSYDEFNQDNDKLVSVDNEHEVWICDYITEISPTLSDVKNKEMKDLSANIISNGNLKVGYYRTYSVEFSDTAGNNIDWDKLNFSWSIVSDFDVEQIICDNTIKLRVNDETLVGKTFLLQCKVNNMVNSEIEIPICELM